MPLRISSLLTPKTGLREPVIRDDAAGAEQNGRDGEQQDIPLPGRENPSQNSQDDSRRSKNIPKIVTSNYGKNIEKSQGREIFPPRKTMAKPT